MGKAFVMDVPTDGRIGTKGIVIFSEVWEELQNEF